MMSGRSMSLLATVATLLMAAAAPIELVAGRSPLPAAGIGAKGLPLGASWLPDGSVIKPWGAIVPLGTLPLGLALSPDGRLAAVSDDGTLPGVSIVDLARHQVVQRLAVPAPFLGLAWNPGGDRLAVADSGQDEVLVYQRQGDRLVDPVALDVAGFPAGLAFGAGDRLYAAANMGGNLAVASLPAVLPPVLSPTGRPGLPSPPEALSASSASRSGEPFARLASTLVHYLPGANMPYAVAVATSSVLVTDRNAAAVDFCRLDGQMVDSVKVGQQPAAVVVQGDRAYVANAGSDTVSVLSVSQPGLVATWPVPSWPGAPLGAMPSALALGPDRLYVALSGINAVSVLDLQTGREQFRIPTAWYPSALALTPDGSQLLVLAAKGLGSGPSAEHRRAVKEMPGLLEYGPTPMAADFPVAIATQSRGFAGKSKSGEAVKVAAALPRVEHVVFIMRENRTYDQVLGDLPGGEGDPRLADFGGAVTPNAHAIARQFATSDAFYAAGEVSAQGHQWALGGRCSDYVERLWPSYEGGRGHPYDPHLPQANPPGGAIIEHCLRHGVSARMYGAELTRGPDLQVLPELRSAFDPRFVGWDLHVMDQRRVDEWEREFQGGRFERFEFIWLPNDHTAGLKAGYPTPRAMVADNDLATGRLLGLLSHGPHWKDTVVFIAEDDAQGGLDHVDAHRSVLLAAGPLIKRHYVSHQAISQPAVLHTMLQMLGLPPITSADAAAPALADFFSPRLNFATFEPLAAEIRLDSLNPRSGPGATRAARLDLSRPDQDFDDDLKAPAVALKLAAHHSRSGRLHL